MVPRVVLLLDLDSGRGASSRHLRGAMRSMDPAYVEHGSRVPLDFKQRCRAFSQSRRPIQELHYMYLVKVSGRD